MRLLLIFIFVIFSNFLFSQNYDYLWDNGLWKKYLEQGADSNGVFTKNYSTGQKKIEGEFKNGIPVGKWSFWKKNGKLKAESDYNGDINIWHHFLGSGRYISVIGQYSNGMKTGVWDFYYNDSICDIEINYSDSIYNTYFINSAYKNRIDSINYFSCLSNSIYEFEIDEGGLHFEVGYGKHYLKDFYLDKNTNYVEFNLPERQIAFKNLDFLKYSLVGSFNEAYFAFNYTNYFNYELIDNGNNYTLHGNNVLFNFGIDAIYVNVVDMAFLAGAGFGNLKLDKSDIEGNITKFRNPSLLLNLMSDFRVNIPLSDNYGVDYKLGIGGRFGLQSDISDKRWKNKNENIKLENRWTMTGYYWQVFVSLGLY